MRPRCSRPHRTAILTARDMASSNAQLETTLTASAQLFAAPHGAPQFRVVRVRVKARPRADRYLPGEESSSTWYCTETRETRCFLVEGDVGKHSRCNEPAQGDGSPRTVCMTKDGCACVICGSASAAASGRPEVWEDIGDRSAHGEGWVTQHGSFVVRLSVRDRVAVGGGRMYTAVVPRSS
jgi:hypothetical protein